MSQLRSISQLTLVNICGLGVTAVDSVVTAQWFGTTDPMRNYFLALTLLLMVQKLFMVGQFSDVFLPQYVKIRETQGLEKADRCFSALYNHVMLSLVFAAMAFALVAGWLSRVIAPGFLPEAQTQVMWFSLGLLPSILLLVANGHLQIIGNARGWYGRFELFGVLGNALGLVAMISVAGRVGVWAVVLSQVVTQLVMLACSLWSLTRHGYRHAWILHEPGFSAWTVSGRVGVTALYVFATQWYTLAFNAALSFLPGSLLTVYKYAESLYTKTATIFLRPVSVVFFTDASVLAHHEPEKLRARIAHGLYHYALFYAVVAGVVFPVVPNLLGAMWGGSNYSATEITETTFYISCLYLLLMVDAVGLLYRRLNIAVGGVLPQYLAMTMVQLAMVPLAPWLVDHLQYYGAPAVLAVNVVAMLLTSLAVHARSGVWYLAFFPRQTWKLAVAIVPSLFLVWLAPHWLPWLRYAGDTSLRGKLLEITKAALRGGCGLVLLCTIVFALNVEEAHGFWRWLRTNLLHRINGPKLAG